MVQKGVSLKEVADVLGHRSLDTTAIYAKLDLPTLREVALPWPGGAPMTPPSFDRLVLFFSLAGSSPLVRGSTWLESSLWARPIIDTYRRRQL